MNGVEGNVYPPSESTWPEMSTYKWGFITFVDFLVIQTCQMTRMYKYYLSQIIIKYQSISLNYINVIFEKENIN